MSNWMAPRAQTWKKFFFPALTFFTSFTDSLTIQHLPRQLVERAIPDPFTPHEPPFNWYALGDSYTAGPGAGDLDPSDQGDCVRSVGSYGPQLQSDWIYTDENELTFLACTGAKTGDVLSNQLPEMSSDPPPDFAVITIGGNDIGFSKIVKACLIGLVGAGDCDDKIAAARERLDNEDFLNRLSKVYDGVFDQMPNDFHYQMIHLGYSRFFDEDPASTWCNDQTFGKFGLSGLSPPKLAIELRKKLNRLTDDLNIRLHAHLLGYVLRRLNQDAAQDGWRFVRLWYSNYDQNSAYSFDGHRFCQPGVEDSKFQDPSTWFYGVWGDQPDATVSADAFASIDAASCNSDPKYDSDEAFAWDCDMAVYYADPSTDHNVTTITAGRFIQAFHPKTSGFTSIKNFLATEMLRVRNVPPINECIAAPGPDLENPSSLAYGYPASICATGTSAYATALGTPTPIATTHVPSTTSAAAAPSGTCASQCTCYESGCSTDSPGCCGNGICDPSC